MGSFLTRALVAIVAIPALLYLFYLGDLPLRFSVGFLIIVACVEAWRLAGRAGAIFPITPMILVALAVPFVSARNLPGISWPIWVVLITLTAGASVLAAKDARRAALGIAAHIVTILWIAIGFGAILGLRHSIDGQGFRWLLFLFANLWVGDTAAYLFGVWLGEKKLVPMISPNKTVVGAVAQILTSLAVACAFFAFGWIQAGATLLIAGSFLIAIVGQIGDLFESVLKRAADQKDSSTIIPGHGGVLDRFDSALFAAPGLYSLLSIWPR